MDKEWENAFGYPQGRKQDGALRSPLQKLVATHLCAPEVEAELPQGMKQVIQSIQDVLETADTELFVYFSKFTPKFRSTLRFEFLTDPAPQSAHRQT
jgi:hypothetical protein